MGSDDAFERDIDDEDHGGEQRKVEQIEGERTRRTPRPSDAAPPQGRSVHR
jgi:hypothetical protein